jgi:hypothetical protein
MWSEFLFHLVSLPVCVDLYVVRLSMSLGLTSVLYVSLWCPSFYVTWSHFRFVWVSMLSEFLCHLVSLPFYMGLCILTFYVTWSHFRYAWVLVLSECLCHLFSLSLCMGLYVIWVYMSLGLTFVMYGSLFVLSFYVSWSHFHYILVMCCLSFSVTWSHFRSICVLSLFAILVLFYLYVRDCVTFYRRYNFFRKIPSKWRNKLILRQLLLQNKYKNVHINQVVECMSH